jgi:hypothetical protein
MSKKPSKTKLPRPNAAFRTSDQTGDVTPAEILGMICNPIYAGMGPYPTLVTDEQWVAAAATAINKEGAEQFLVNLLHVLRQTLALDED